MNTNLETLKQELIAQKSAIEEKLGTVVVKNTNPSPSEITEGIKSIEIVNMDLSAATASPNEVLEGYTFYGGTDRELKTGTLKGSILDGDITQIIFYNSTDTPSTEPLSFVVPNNVNEIKHYLNPLFH